MSAEAAQTSSISSRVRPSGFSTNTALPARSAAAASSAWESWRLPIRTRSIAGSVRISAGSVPATAPPPAARAAFAALTPLRLTTRVTAARGLAVRLGMWTARTNAPAPISPTPTVPLPLADFEAAPELRSSLASRVRPSRS